MPARRLEARLSQVLGIGVRLSTVLLAVGLGLALVYDTRHPTADMLLNAGLAVLLATPIVRVLVSMVAFIHVRDWRFAILTGIVLAVLAGSVVVAVR